VESKWKNYHIITFPGQSLSKTLEEAMDLSQDRLILELDIVWATDSKYSEFQKELYNFERVYKCIQRTYTTF
jgi:hypothetical protein